ncbi:hypothetical protein H2200_000124 [Cladophialophora chaetospira]|uniref:Uncharacterized protein n=1 Tax=Cladophialophora chaetospira TaxID=386627 RepID=A0AA39CQN7_9EURO|nr:hypothetical protein H2200_000124 [Cladophialophora chaetospira]
MAPPRKSENKQGVKPGSTQNQVRWTRTEMEHALNSMRQRLAPQITDRALLQQYLEVDNLDVDRAVNRWQTHRARILAGAAPPPSDSSSSSSSDSDGEDDGEGVDEGGIFEGMQANAIAERFNANIEQERRDAALAFRLEIEDSSVGYVVLSPSQAIFFLYICGWDLGVALSRWNSTSLKESFLLLGEFDRMRKPLHREIDVSDEVTLLAQDERLATFINITGRPDWYSLRERLVEADWNLIEAVAAWFRPGVRPERPSSTGNGPGIRVDVNLRELDWPADGDCDAAEGTVMDEGWGQEPNYFAPDNPFPNPPNPVKENPVAATTKPRGTKPIDGRERRNGFLIHIDSSQARETAQIGIRNPELFLIEWICKGKYWYNRFKHNKLGFPEYEAAQNIPPRANPLPEFDWKNQDHINLLNNWRRQVTNRATGYNTRQGSQLWSQEEIDFLISLTEELFQEAKREFKDKTEAELLPLVITNKVKEDWQRRFNAKFTGTIQPGSDKERIDRKSSALMTQRGRIRILVDKYKVTEDKQWFKRQENKKEKAKAKVKVGEKRKRDSSQEVKRESSQEVEEITQGEFESTIATAASDGGESGGEEEEQANDADDEE